MLNQLHPFVATVRSRTFATILMIMSVLISVGSTPVKLEVLDTPEETEGFLICITVLSGLIDFGIGSGDLKSRNVLAATRRVRTHLLLVGENISGSFRWQVARGEYKTKTLQAFYNFIPSNQDSGDCKAPMVRGLSSAKLMSPLWRMRKFNLVLKCSGDRWSAT